MAIISNGNGRGRKKIKMEKIENESNRQVTFSKRRQGVFKKAHELTVLTGAKVAIIVFSPGGKVYSFGHPTVEAVTDRFRTGISRRLTAAQQEIENEHKQYVSEGNASLSNVRDQLDLEKKRAKALNQLGTSHGRQWSAINYNGQNMAQLQHLLEAMTNLRAEVKRVIIAGASSGVQNFTPPLPIPCAGGYAFLPYSMQLSGYSVAGSDGGLPSQAGLGFYRSAGPAGGWPVTAGISSVGGGAPFVFRPNIFGHGGGGGTPVAGPISPFGGGGLATIDWASSSGGGRFGGGILVPGPSYLFGGDILQTIGSASSSGGGWSGGDRTLVAGSSSLFGGGVLQTIDRAGSFREGQRGGETLVGCSSLFGAHILPTIYSASSSREGRGGCGTLIAGPTYARSLPTIRRVSSSGGVGNGFSSSNATILPEDQSKPHH